MFETFDTEFSLDSKEAISVSLPVVLSALDPDVKELVGRYGGRSFNDGLYRVLHSSDVSAWNDLVSKAFPNFAGRLTCFAVDWLGRVFALDSSRSVEGCSGVLMLEPGTGDALEIPCNIQNFHDVELLNYRDAALAEGFFFQWLAKGGVKPKIAQCVGYKKPLFLGGKDTVENLELVDLDVYWTIAAQLIHQVKGLAAGTSIGKVTIS